MYTDAHPHPCFHIFMHTCTCTWKVALAQTWTWIQPTCNKQFFKFDINILKQYFYVIMKLSLFSMFALVPQSFSTSVFAWSHSSVFACLCSGKKSRICSRVCGPILHEKFSVCDSPRRYLCACSQQCPVWLSTAFYILVHNPNGCHTDQNTVALLCFPLLVKFDDPFPAGMGSLEVPGWQDTRMTPCQNIHLTTGHGLIGLSAHFLMISTVCPKSIASLCLHWDVWKLKSIVKMWLAISHGHNDVMLALSHHCV